MDPYISRYIILAILIMLSAFFSSAETAFSSVNIIRIKNYVEEKRRGAKKALKVAENYDETLSTILIGNNIVNIGATSLATIIAFEIVDDQNLAALYSTIFLTIIILIFGEVLPKSFAKEHAEKLALNIGATVYYLTKILKPIVIIFILIKSLFSRIINAEGNLSPSVTEDELEVIMDTMEEEGVLEEDEREMLQSVLDLDETKIHDIFTPRVDMVAVNVSSTIDEVKEVFFNEQFSRIPVYDRTVDNVIGILYERDFFTSLIKNEQTVIKNLMRKPTYVPKSMRVSDLIELLQRTKQHMAIVSDEYGGTSGIVTMEDALEELVGEIYDEHDEEVTEIIKIEDNKYEISAAYDLDDLFEDLDIDKVPNSQYATVGGWLYELFETIPSVGDTITHVIINEIEEDIIEEIKLKFTVTKLVHRRMELLSLEIDKTNS